MNVPKQLIWTAGDEPDADKFNLYIRDTLNFILDTPEGFMEQTTAQPITAGAWTVQSMQAIVKDNDNMITLSSAGTTSQLVINTPGWYEFEYGGAFAGTASDTVKTNRQIVALQKNGNTAVRYGRYEIETYPLNLARVIGGVTYAAYMNVGDYMELVLFYDGASRSTAVSSDNTIRTYIKGKWVSK